ncbi:MAG: response regulator transcription factor [Niabella sp.]
MKKILIVEDEFIIAHRVKELLEQKKLGNCHITDTYKDSVQYIKAELPDLVLLDIRLFEDEDAGICLAHFLQDHYNIPFIFLSGYSDNTTLKNAKLYKPATFITKPIIEKQLLAAVEMALPETATSKIKAAYIKGKYFENITYEKLMKASFADYDFINKEIRFDDITIIQAFNHVKRNTVLFKFKQPKTFFILGSTIEKIGEILPPFFEQVHQSYIINTQYITAKRNGSFLIVADEEVPIGAAYKVH